MVKTGIGIFRGPEQGGRRRDLELPDMLKTAFFMFPIQY